MHPRVVEVTERLVERSRATRQRYLEMIRAAASEGPQRGKLQCANFAHGVAGCSGHDKQTLRLMGVQPDMSVKPQIVANDVEEPL